MLSLLRERVNHRNTFTDPPHDRNRKAIADASVPWSVGCGLAAIRDLRVVVGEALESFAFTFVGSADERLTPNLLFRDANQRRVLISLEQKRVAVLLEPLIMLVAVIRGPCTRMQSRERVLLPQGDGTARPPLVASGFLCL